MDMYPFHYITISRRSKKYVKLYRFDNFSKTNLTPVELKITTNETFDLFDYNLRTRRLRYVKLYIF